MIVEWFSGVGATIAAFIAGMMPEWTAPDWLTGVGSGFQTIADYAQGLGVWIPLPLMVSVLGVVLATWVVCFTIKLFLRIASHAPWFGGAG